MCPKAYRFVEYIKVISVMKKEKVYSLCEAVADISCIAAEKGYRTDNSRLMISQFIEWAEEFEKLHKNIQWGINPPLEYIESIYYFTTFKINQWRST
jgi:hypothetical protein